jgi:predicted nucleotidyltransferase
VSNEALRQWPLVLETVRRAEHLAGFAAAILIGSFAAGTADDLSDVDLIFAVEDGAFEGAWAERESLRPGDALYWWDVRTEPDCEVGAHKWITRELVLVEGVIAAPAARARLADPHRVISGDAAAVDGFVRIPPIERTELADYAARLAQEGHTPAVQLRYEELVRALRAEIPARS